MPLLDALLAYLPPDRRDAIAADRELPAQTIGAALWADLSGFTPLTEMLVNQLGPRHGADELAFYLNRIYTALIVPVEAWGGSVIDFSGDAITCWFDADDGQRAVSAAQAMQASMQPFENLRLRTGGIVSLGVKIAIACGPVRRFRVGDPNIQYIDTLAGITLDWLAVAGNFAHTGEILLNEALSTQLPISEWRTDPETGRRFAVLSHSAAIPVASADTAAYIPTLTEEQIRPWVLPEVFACIQSGQGEFLTELCPAVALFICFEGLNYDDALAGLALDTLVCHVQRILTEYGGTLLQLTIDNKGSYIYAAFGAPVAHEDDITRAAAAALKLRLLPEQVRGIHAVSMGMSQGLMRTGGYGSTTRRTYGVLGEDANLAARLMQQAAPGQILASESIWQADTDFRWQTLPLLKIKGRQVLVEPAELLGWREQNALDLPQITVAFPMIGRQAELALLEEKLALVRLGQGQIVSVVGEAGLGKSRFLAEILERASDLTRYGGECQSYGTHSAYLPWQPILRALFGLDQASSTVEQIRGVEQALAQINPHFIPRLPLLDVVLDLPIPDNGLTRDMDAKMRKTLRESLLVECVRAWAEQPPLILILEDLHWSDPLSLDLLMAVARAMQSFPVLILLAYRPPTESETDFFLPTLTGLAYHTRIDLVELVPVETEQLIASRLRNFGFDGPVPPMLVGRLSARAQGNPFYIEELLNYQHDRGLDPRDDSIWEQGDLPESLHSLILSRIDQLSEQQQITIKAASVIGRLFRASWLYEYYPSLNAAQVTDDLVALHRQAFVVQDTPEPQLAYLFKHVIMQEVAYENLAYATRASLHAQFASYLEQVAGDGASSFLDLLAYHYDRSENKDRALHYLILAGQKAIRNYNISESQRYFENAFSLLPVVEHSNQQALEIHTGLGDALALAGDYPKARVSFERAAQALALDENINYETVCSLQRKIGMTYECQGYYDQALACLDAARRALAQGGLDSPVELSQVLNDAGWVHFNCGDLGDAEKYLMQALQLAEKAGRPDIVSSIYNRLGGVHYHQDHLQQAHDFVIKSIAIREEIGDILGVARSYGNLGNLCWKLGLWDEALDHFKHSAELQIKLGDEEGIIKLNNNLGLLQMDRGYIDEARQYLEDALTRAENIGHKLDIALTLHHISLTFSMLDEWDAALAYGLRSEALFKNVGTESHIADVYVNLGEIYLGLLDLPKAVYYAEQTFALLNEFSAEVDLEVKGFALRLYGDIALTSHDIDQATERYHQAEKILDAVGNRLEQGRLLMSMVKLSAAQSNKALTEFYMTSAQKRFEQLGAQLDLLKLETLKKELSL